MSYVVSGLTVNQVEQHQAFIFGLSLVYYQM